MQEYVIDFGEIAHPEHAKLIIYSWINYKYVAEKSDINSPMIISVINETGQWNRSGT